MKDKKIIQKKFLKWKKVFNFKKKWIDYEINESDIKMKFFVSYDEIDNLEDYIEVKSSSLYYILVWTLFFFIWVLFKDIITLLFWVVFFVLYYKSRENYLQFSTIYGNNILISNDEKKQEILNEIKERQNNLRKEREFIIDEYSSYDYEKEKFDNLLKEKIISKKEYNDILIKLDNFSFKEI